MKNLNKVRDMKNARYHVIIHGDYIKLKRIQLMYKDFDGSNEYYSPEISGTLILRMPIKERDMLVKCCNLKLKEGTRQKRDWVIED